MSTRKEVKRLNTNLVLAVHWAAAEYSYIKELRDELQELKKEKDVKKEIKDIQKSLKIFRYLSKAERRAFNFEERVKGDFQKILKELSTYIGDDFSSKRKLMEEIRTVVNELGIEHHSLLEYASGYEGLLKKELNEAEIKVQLEKKYPKKSKQIHFALIQLIEKIEKQVLDMDKWVKALEGSLKRGAKLLQPLINEIEGIKESKKSRLIYNRKEPTLIGVKRVFVLANKFKGKLGLDERFDIDRSLFIAVYRKTYAEVSKYSEEELDALITDKTRLKRFNLCKWKIKTVRTKDMGAWPSFGGIDHFTTCGNLIETGKKINDILYKNHIFTWPESSPENLPGKKVEKFFSIGKHVDIIFRLFPIIVTEKGSNTRRVKANAWASKKLGFNYEITPFDIEDGNHRSMAYSMMGIKKIKCFVGSGLTTDKP